MTLKTELADHFDSHGEAKRELFDLHRRVLQHAAPPFEARLRQSGRIRATLLVRQERAMRVMVEIAAIASIRKPRRMPRSDSENLGWRFCSMAKLVYGLNQSLDGYVDHMRIGSPGPALSRHFMEHARGLTGVLYGRRMYEIMR